MTSPAKPDARGCCTDPVTAICSSNSITDERVAKIEEDRLERFRLIEAETRARRAEQNRARMLELEQLRVRKYEN